MCVYSNWMQCHQKQSSQIKFEGLKLNFSLNSFKFSFNQICVHVNYRQLQNLRVECAVQRCLIGLVVYESGGAVLQQSFYDALVTPAWCNVQCCVALIILHVQPAHVQVIVDQRLHTLRDKNTFTHVKKRVPQGFSVWLCMVGVLW